MKLSGTNKNKIEKSPYKDLKDYFRQSLSKGNQSEQNFEFMSAWR